MLFLIISTFSFIFAATIFNNAGSEVTLGELKTVEKYMIYAKNIVEFLGLYPLILSTPMVIGTLTNDNFLRTSIIVIAVIGIALYSQSKFSILEKQLPSYQKGLYSAGIVVISSLMYLTQTMYTYDTPTSYTSISVCLLSFLLLTNIFFTLRSKQYRIVMVRHYRDNDALTLSKLVDKNLKRSIHNKQAHKLSKHLLIDYSEDSIRKLAAKQQIFVATTGSRRVGFVSVVEGKIMTIFTDPDLHRKGIGRLLIEASELTAMEHGYEEMVAYAHSPSDRFYKRVGYSQVE